MIALLSPEIVFLQGLTVSFFDCLKNTNISAYSHKFACDGSSNWELGLVRTSLIQSGGPSISMCFPVK